MCSKGRFDKVTTATKHYVIKFMMICDGFSFTQSICRYVGMQNVKREIIKER